MNPNGQRILRVGLRLRVGVRVSGGSDTNSLGGGGDGIDDSRAAHYVCGMSTVAEIKAAIDKLSPRERCELNALLRGWDEDEWDRQMAADSLPGGKLDKLREAAEADGYLGTSSA